jgi:hypothetical protein
VETGPFVSSHHRPWISIMAVGVRGPLTKFKRRRGVAKSVNVPRFKIGQDLSIPTSPCQVSPPAALLVKRSAGQINVIVHAVGILVALPKILEAWRAPAESVARRREYGARARSRDRSTHRRVPSWARWGCSESARAPVVHGDRAAAERLRRDQLEPSRAGQPALV